MNLFGVLLIPFCWILFAKWKWDLTITWKESGVQFVLVTLIIGVVWETGKYGKLADVEIWNGQITSKERKHDTYEDAYDCMCTTDSNGYESCSTCYETHYTVTWSAESTVGGFQFDHLDSTWRSVYNKPDPESYKKCVIGEPASKMHSFTNYVKAVPESLFNDNTKIAKKYELKNMIPPYPKVYDFYRINRVINIGTDIKTSDIKQINDHLNTVLRTTGTKKQANIIVILVNGADRDYRYAIEKKWIGGKKNDIVVILGMSKYPKIDWVEIMTWARNKGNELFQVKLRDDLRTYGKVDDDKFVTIINERILSTFDRPEMAKFKYLEDAVEPPQWAKITALFLAFFGSIGLTILFHRVDLFDDERRPRNSFRRYR